MNWIKKTEDGVKTFSCSEIFNGCTYTVTVWVYDYLKRSEFWVGLSSGKKRRDLEIFEPKENKSTGGIAALLWAKEMMLSFPEYYGNPYNQKQFICVHWADARRRDIYSRLINDGFGFIMKNNQKILIKKV